MKKKRNRTPEEWIRLFKELYGREPTATELQQLISNYSASVLSEVFIVKNDKDSSA